MKGGRTAPRIPENAGWAERFHPASMKGGRTAPRIHRHGAGVDHGRPASMKGGRTAPRIPLMVEFNTSRISASMKGGRTAPRIPSPCWSQLAWGKLAYCEWVGIFCLGNRLSRFECPSLAYRSREREVAGDGAGTRPLARTPRRTPSPHSPG